MAEMLQAVTMGEAMIMFSSEYDIDIRYLEAEQIGPGNIKELSPESAKSLIKGIDWDIKNLQFVIKELGNMRQYLSQFVD